MPTVATDSTVKQQQKKNPSCLHPSVKKMQESNTSWNSNISTTFLVKKIHCRSCRHIVCTRSVRMWHSGHSSSVLESADIFSFLMRCSVWNNFMTAALRLSEAAETQQLPVRCVRFSLEGEIGLQRLPETWMTPPKQFGTVHIGTVLVPALCETPEWLGLSENVTRAHTQKVVQ